MENKKEIQVKDLVVGDKICGTITKEKVTKINKTKDKGFVNVYYGDGENDCILYNEEQIIIIENTIFNVTGLDIVNSYNKLYSKDKITAKEDVQHFSVQWQNWIDLLRVQLSHRKPADLSLNKRNFLGKKTRALLHAINMKEPKTLGLLIGNFWELIPEK